MRLSDIMGHAGLARYAEIALILFMLAFVVVVIRTLRSPRHEIERQARLPLEPNGDAPDESEEP